MQKKSFNLNKHGHEEHFTWWKQCNLTFYVVSTNYGHYWEPNQNKNLK